MRAEGSLPQVTDGVGAMVGATPSESHQPKISSRQPNDFKVNKGFSSGRTPEGVEGSGHSVGANGAMVGAETTFGLMEAATLCGVTKEGLRVRLSRQGTLYERVSETGPNKGRKEKVVEAETLFGLYPDARRVYENRIAAQAALEANAIEQAKPAIAPPQDPKAIQDFQDWQRRRMDARIGLLRYIEQQVMGLEITRESAVNRLLVDAEMKRLPAEIQILVPLANARAGKSGERTLSRRTVQRWSEKAKHGIDFLAPAPMTHAMPSWLPALLDLYRQPQKPSLSWCVQALAAMLPPGAPKPSYDAARRALNKVGAVEREKGRMLPRELKNIKPFRRREKPDFPFDVLTADGHTFDAEIAHPEHGRPFRPEVTVVVDVATNRVVGWSAGEKENTWSVVDALRQSILMGGIPLIFYTDNGPGYKNDRMATLATRLGFQLHYSIPYNSKARGVVEHLQKTLWIDLGAKAFSTYVGASMDREARQIVFKAGRKGQPVLPSWRTFVNFMEVVVETFNARPSKACPKILNADSGRMRHISPGATWDQAERLGWMPEGLPLSLDDFRPEEIRQVNRGEINLFGNRYFNSELEELHGDKVRVIFDIHDPSKIWVRNLAGEMVCEAGFETNKSAYFPQAYVDQLREQRKVGQQARLTAKAHRVLDDGPDEPVYVRDLTPEVMEASAEQLRKLAPAHEPMVPAIHLMAAPDPAASPAGTRPAFQDSTEYALWVLANPDRADAEELEEIQGRLRRDPLYRILLGREDADTA